MTHNEKRGQAISQSFFQRVSLYFRDSFRRFIYFVSSLILERCNLPKNSELDGSNKSLYNDDSDRNNDPIVVS